jgi:hypothetical protein
MKFLASLKLAVMIMAAICVLIATGTIIESRYDAEAATKLVYQTYWMKITLLMLAVNLIAVMVDRWPWRKKHIAFLLAHVGILMILGGSWLTQKYGVDGNMRIELAKSNRFVITNQTDLSLFQSSDGANFNETYKREVDFFLNPPTEQNPYIVVTGGSEIQIIDYKSYVIPQKKVIPTNDVLAGSGLRYQLQNSRVNQIDWLVQSNTSETVSQDLGPAEIILAAAPMEMPGKNAIVLVPSGQRIHYFIFHKDKSQPFLQGTVNEGESIPLGWMDLQLKILRYFSMAEQTWEVSVKERPTALTTSAIKIKYQDLERWVLLNDLVRLNRTGSLMRLVYAQRRQPLKFAVNLKKFEIERYQGTQKASAYKSVVEVPSFGEHLISMNEPMNIGGLLFYQASFEEDRQGEPTASIFSVNYDPGRWIKYIGSLIMSLGIISLFYLRKFYQG